MIVLTSELAGYIAWGLRLVIDQLERDGLRHRIPTSLRHLERWSTAVYEGQAETPLAVPVVTPESDKRGVELLTVKDAAVRCNISTRQVSRAIESGSLPSYKLGSSRRIRPEDLTTWIEEHRE